MYSCCRRAIKQENINTQINNIIFVSCACISAGKCVSREVFDAADFVGDRTNGAADVIQLAGAAVYWMILFQRDGA